MSGHSAVGSASALGAESRGFESHCPDHFFAQISGKKHEAVRVRFMARLVRRSLGEGGRAASYDAAVLHAPQVRFIYSPFQACLAVALAKVEEPLHTPTGVLHAPQVRFIYSPFQTCLAVALAKVEEPFHAALASLHTFLMPDGQRLQAQNVLHKNAFSDLAW